MVPRSIRTLRLGAILIVALALSPGLWWRAPMRADSGLEPLRIARLPELTPGTRLAPDVVLAGAWHMASKGEVFGGYSALVPLPAGQFLALSDRGWFLRFGDPLRGPGPKPSAGAVGHGNMSDKRQLDIEAATRDPASDTFWLAYENANAIRRFGPDLADSQEVRPPAMQGWPSNRGPEAMVRLADGRFVVLSEAVDGGSPLTAQGLLFDGDPVDGVDPAPFRFVPPHGFRATDMAQLPDGRVVILLRKLEVALPPRIVSRLIVADPATIAVGEEWVWEPLTEIGDPLPRENYEGLAIEPREGGSVRLWVISDDNGAALQRTLLFALDWTPRTALKQRSDSADKGAQAAQR